jgi:hypothetical protein
MTVRITCPCGKRFRAADQFAGMCFRCPFCLQVLELPRPLTGTAPETPLVRTIVEQPPAPTTARTPFPVARGVRPPPGAWYASSADS